MRIIIQWIILMILIAGSGDAQENGYEMFVSDGELVSKPLEVFITHEINEFMDPKLKLLSSHIFLEKNLEEDKEILPAIVAPNQRRIYNSVGYTGTLLIFNIHDYPIRWFQPLMRVSPVLSWKDSADTNIKHYALGNQIYISNGLAVILWTSLMVIIFCIVLGQWSISNSNSFLYLLLTPYGNLSLSKTQVALWTVATGALVFGFGLTKLEVPDIPESLIVLMGLSLATRGVVSYKGRKEAKSDPEYFMRSTTFQEPIYRFSDLICESYLIDNDPNKRKREPSLAKAQMFFWTVLMLILFVMKSMLDGVLWEIPWEMVALMGISKAAYVTPDVMKIVKKNGNAQ